MDTLFPTFFERILAIDYSECMMGGGI
jgi:hypothetical protein